MKLIDLDSLGVGMANPAVFENRAHADGWNSLLTILLQAPVVDEEPVRHGRWKTEEDDYAWWWVCSECGEHVYAYTSYCPECGCKMDGGEEDGPS